MKKTATEKAIGATVLCITFVLFFPITLLRHAWHVSNIFLDQLADILS